jgi:hypothetical protein
MGAEAPNASQGRQFARIRRHGRKNPIERSSDAQAVGPHRQQRSRPGANWPRATCAVGVRDGIQARAPLEARAAIPSHPGSPYGSAHAAPGASTRRPVMKPLLAVIVPAFGLVLGCGSNKGAPSGFSGASGSSGASASASGEATSGSGSTTSGTGTLSGDLGGGTSGGVLSGSSGGGSSGPTDGGGQRVSADGGSCINIASIGALGSWGGTTSALINRRLPDQTYH